MRSVTAYSVVNPGGLQPAGTFPLFSPIFQKNLEMVTKGDRLIELESSSLERELQSQQAIVTGRISLEEQCRDELRQVESQNRFDIDNAAREVKKAENALRKYCGEEWKAFCVSVGRAGKVEEALWNSRTIGGDLELKRTDIQGRRKEMIGQITKSASDIILLKDKAAHSNKMVELGYLSLSQAQGDELKLKSAELDREKLTIALKKLDVEEDGVKSFEVPQMILTLESDLLRTRQALETARFQAVLKENQVKVRLAEARATLDTERLKLQSIEQDLNNCIIYAPNSGTVVYHVSEQSRYSSGSSQRIIAVSEQVSEGQRLMRIPDLQSMQVTMKLHESLIIRAGERVKVGRPAEIRLSAQEKPLRGKVVSVSSVASAMDFMSGDVRVYPTIISIDDEIAGLDLRPGTTAEVKIFVDSRSNVLRLPVQAVLAVGEEKFCYVKDGDEIKRRVVVTGLNNNKFVEIKEGLREGELVCQNPRNLAERLGDLNAAEASESSSNLRREAEKIQEDQGTNSGRPPRSGGEDGKGPTPKSGTPGAKPGTPPGGTPGSNPQRKQLTPEQWAKRVEEYRAATPEQRNTMLQSIPEGFRESLKKRLEAEGITFPN
jgi:multidrug efflux pump subunit AcrA (membrane-fusion protein)